MPMISNEQTIEKHYNHIVNYLNAHITELTALELVGTIATILAAVLHQLDDEEMTNDTLTELQLVLAKPKHPEEVN